MKRFWKAVHVETADDGWAILLDGRPVRTPAKRQVIMPIQQMAEEVAAEWDAQEGEVQPLSMSMTRTAATCLDRVAPELDTVRQMIAAYGETDLLCYRAEHPTELIQRQSEAWDPMLTWAKVRTARESPSRISFGPPRRISVRVFMKGSSLGSASFVASPT